MSTDQDKIRAYYASFDEWARLDSPEGALEFRRTLKLLDFFLKPNSRILDLGGGPGRYTVELLKCGHRVSLADLSPELLNTVRDHLKAQGLLDQLDSIDVLSADDLSMYPDSIFDAVIAFGPFYHMTKKTERQQAAQEMYRVLSPSGRAVVAYMLFTSGIRGLIDRACMCPEQVPADVLKEAMATGIFHNATNSGFQEGYFAQDDELETKFERTGFTVYAMHSLKGLGNGYAEKLTKLPVPLEESIKHLMDTMSGDAEIIAIGGHAVIVLEKLL